MVRLDRRALKERMHARTRGFFHNVSQTIERVFFTRFLYLSRNGLQRLCTSHDTLEHLNDHLTIPFRVLKKQESHTMTWSLTKS